MHFCHSVETAADKWNLATRCSGAFSLNSTHGLYPGLWDPANVQISTQRVRFVVEMEKFTLAYFNI